MTDKNRVLLSKLIVGIVLFGFCGSAFAQAMYIHPTGNIGVGTDVPIYKFDIIGDDDLSGIENTTALYVTNASAVSAGRVMLGLSNNGTARFSIENTAVPDGDGRWVFSVGNNPTFRISKANTPVVEFEVTQTGDVNAQGTFNTLSDRNSKTNIQSLDPQSVLAKVVSLPLSTWNYKDEPGVTHMGPMAQDFHALFKLGSSDKTIAGTDASGVALAAVQGLHQELEKKEARIQQLETRIAEQEAMLERFQAVEQVVVKLLERKEAQGHLNVSYN